MEQPKVKTHRSTFGVPKIDLTGKTFGRLTVRFQDDPRKVTYGKREKWLIYWNCGCECGNTKPILGEHLRKGAVVSCGCYQKEIQTRSKRTHGMSKSPEYNSYMGALQRCSADKDYKGRGIEFKFTSFEQFMTEVGPRPKGKTLDRKDNDGHYEPGNVHWATPTEQANNTRRKRLDQFSDKALFQEIKRRGLKWKT